MQVRVVSGSMDPTIRLGESVTVEPAKPRVGDVVAIEHGGDLLIHRAVARISMGSRSWFVHQGDASPKCGLASAEEIVGVVPGLWRPTPPPRNLLALRLGALLRWLGLR